METVKAFLKILNNEKNMERLKKEIMLCDADRLVLCKQEEKGGKGVG